MKSALIQKCVVCGSERLKKVEKGLVFEVGNPKIVKVEQHFTECQNCGEGYFDEKQSSELAKKLDEKLKN